MANDEVLGPRKTMFVLVIVVGCFAVLWPRILSPLILGSTSEQLKPNKFDREAGCCEVIFGTEVAVLEFVNEVCGSAGGDGKFSVQSVAECRKAVNDTCGLDIAAFVKRNENVGRTTKMLVETLKNSNSSCLRTNFGVPVYSLSTHLAVNSWEEKEMVKQERPPIRAGPHPALRERGRAIPPGTPSKPVALPPHIRVRSPLSPLSVYYDLEIKPPPIPGMRPPLGSPGGPAPAQKTSMGFVMPIYTICIIVFFVYTLSKILFKRTGSPYEPVLPDPEFRRRVFRDDSRPSPDKLVVSAISGLVAEVRQQMESRAPGQQSQEALDSTRPYTNGTIIHNSGPVQIVTSEYRETKEEAPELQKDKELSPKPKETTPEPEDIIEPEKIVEENIKKEELEVTTENQSTDVESKDMISPNDEAEVTKDLQAISTGAEDAELDKITSDITDIGEKENLPQNNENVDLTELSGEIQSNLTNDVIKTAEDFVNEERKELKQEEESTEDLKQEEESTEDLKQEEESTKELKQEEESTKELKQEEESTKELKQEEESTKELKQEEESTQELRQDEESTQELKQDEESTQELLEKAIREDSPQDKKIDDKESQSVKVVGMETTEHPVDGGAWRAEPRLVPPQRPHESEQVQSIFLETEIPQQSSVLVTDFKDTKEPSKDSPLVVSGKITLSLIQDTRGTPDRDLESTQDDFTTASAATQPAEKDEELSDEEIEEEIEIEEIEEEVEEEEEEEPKKTIVK